MKKFSILFFLITTALFFSNPVLSQTTGRNVNKVTYVTGSFNENTPGNWLEHAPNNGRYKFVETNRDDWSVYMFDKSRDISIQLDLYKKKIYIYWERPGRRVLYDITGATSKSAITKSTALPKGYKKCASENGTTFFKNKVDIAYGANGKFVYRKGVEGSVKFDNATFGDPIPGVVKAGYFRRIPKKKN
jgi:hypothetical protein